MADIQVRNGPIYSDSILKKICGNVKTCADSFFTVFLFDPIRAFFSVGLRTGAAQAGGVRI